MDFGLRPSAGPGMTRCGLARATSPMTNNVTYDKNVIYEKCRTNGTSAASAQWRIAIDVGHRTVQPELR
jgi:hypothetical protein